MTTPFKYSLKQGFTLVELLVVIGIISILATILLLQLGPIRAKSRDVQRIAHVSQLRGVAEDYLSDYGFYPNSTTWSSAINGITMTKYINPLPKDPLGTCAVGIYTGVTGGSNCYGYTWVPTTSATKYQVWAQLEVFNNAALGSDSDINSTGVDWTGFGANVTGAETCSATTAATTGTSNCAYDLGIK